MTNMAGIVEVRPGRPSNSLHYVVGEMSGKLDHLLTLVTRVESIDGRVTALEAWKAKMLGGSAVIFTLVGAWELVRYVSHP